MSTPEIILTVLVVLTLLALAIALGGFRLDHVEPDAAPEQRPETWATTKDYSQPISYRTRRM